MTWLRATLKALGWAGAAIAACFCVLASEVVSGWVVYAGVLAAVPFLAYSYHHSRRIAWLTAGWEVLIAGTLVLLFLLALGRTLAGFRGPGL
jgi:hypothetical protein